MTQLAASSEEIRQTIKGEKAQERYRLFEDSVRNALMKDGEDEDPQGRSGPPGRVLPQLENTLRMINALIEFLRTLTNPSG